jgi:hypothetical protein
VAVYLFTAFDPLRDVAADLVSVGAACDQAAFGEGRILCLEEDPAAVIQTGTTGVTLLDPSTQAKLGRVEIPASLETIAAAGTVFAVGSMSCQPPPNCDDLVTACCKGPSSQWGEGVRLFSFDRRDAQFESFTSAIDTPEEIGLTSTRMAFVEGAWLDVFDIEDAGRPAQVGSIELDGGGASLFLLSEDALFTAGSGKLRAFAISDFRELSDRPAPRGAAPTSERLDDCRGELVLVRAGTTLYLIGHNGLETYDASSLDALTRVSALLFHAKGPFQAVVVGQALLIGSRDRLFSFDLTDPTHPIPDGVLALDPTTTGPLLTDGVQAYLLKALR